MKTIISFSFSLLCVVLFATPSLFATTVTRAFVHTATPANTSGHVTRLSNFISANAIVLVTQIRSTTNYNNNNEIGVWYNGTQWTIFNQSFAAITNASFNVLVTENNPSFANTLGFNSFVYTATTASIDRHMTIIDNPLTNNKPNAVIIITSNWGNAGPYNNNAVGLWYSNGRWVIFNQNFSPMPANAKFNILVIDRITNEVFGAKVYPTEPDKFSLEAEVQTSSTSNISANTVQLPAFTYGGNIFMTPVWIGTYDANTTGVLYSGGAYRVYHQNNAPMVTNLKFNALAVVQNPW